MNRLFTFGCSFTRYYWPTWADILGREFDYFENWGRVGGGNQYIFNSLIEAKTRNQFTNEDTAIIMWTNVTREDRYIEKKWHTPGNIYTASVYNSDYIKQFADDRGYLIRDLATISATVDLLEHWGVKYHMLSMVPITNIDQYKKKPSTEQDVIDLYSLAVEKIKPSVYEVIFNFDWFSRAEFKSIFEQNLNDDRLKKIYDDLAGPDWPSYEKFKERDFDMVDDHIVAEICQLFEKNLYKVRDDLHPYPAEHLEYIEQIFPEYCISDETRDWVFKYDTLAKQGILGTNNHYRPVILNRL